MAAPTLTATPVSTNYVTSDTSKTLTLNVVAGDLIVISGATEDNASRKLGVPTATGETFTLRRAVEVNSYSPVYIWTATAAATNSALVVTVSATSGSGEYWGATGSVWRDHGGVGANNGANGTGQTTLSLTTTGTDSAIVAVVGDWGAIDASTRSWATINGNAATSQYYARDAVRYTTFGAHWINVGAAGAKAVTLSSPTTLKWSLAAFEVMGTSGSSPITATPTGIASGEAFGTSVVSATLTASPAGIATVEAFGTTVLPITPTGVASGEVVANPVISATLTASPGGVATGEAFGTPVISAIVVASPAAIGSGESFGTAAITATLTASPGSVVTGEAFGAPVVSSGVVVTPGGVATGEVFGSPALSGALIVTPGGVGTAEAAGTAVIGTTISVSPSGIDTGEAAGSPIITATLTATPNGIDTAEAFGVTSIAGAVTVTLTGIATGEALGSPSIVGPATVVPEAIGSGEAFGSPIVTAQLTVTFSGIPTAAAFGTLLALWGRTLSPSAIGSGEVFGSAAISARITTSPAAMTTAEVLGVPTVTRGVFGGNGLFFSTLEGFLAGEIDWDTAAIKVALVRSYSFDPAHRFVSDVTAAGGVIHATSSALAGATVAGGVVDATDVIISAPFNASDHRLLIFQASAVTGGADVPATQQRLIARIGSGAGFPIVPNGGDITITWGADDNRIFNIAPGTLPLTLAPQGINTGEAFGVLVVSNPGTGAIAHGRDIPAAVAAGLVGRDPAVPLTQTISTTLTVTEAYLTGWPNRTIRGLHFINGAGLRPGNGVAAFTVEHCLFEGATTQRLLEFSADSLGYPVARSTIRNNTMTGDPTGQVSQSSAYSMCTGGPYDFIRNDVSGYGSGPHFWVDNGTVIENYIHDLILSPDSAAHTNAILNPGYGGWTIERNWLQNYTEGNDLGGGPSAVLAMYNEPGTALNGGFVRDNVFDGGSFSIYGACLTNKTGVQAVNVTITGNQFNRGKYATGGIYGPAVAFDDTRTGNVWNNNRWGPLGVAISPAEGTIIPSPGPASV